MWLLLLVPLLLAPAPGSSVSASLPGQVPSLGAGMGVGNAPGFRAREEPPPCSLGPPVPAGRANNNNDNDNDNEILSKTDGTLKESGQGA